MLYTRNLQRFSAKQNNKINEIHIQKRNITSPFAHVNLKTRLDISQNAKRSRPKDDPALLQHTTEDSRKNPQ